MELKYIHDEHTHKLSDPEIIVPVIMDLCKPESVIDVGCGLGTFLKVFAKYGVIDYLGIDGPWVNKSLLKKNISLDHFIESDLENEIEISRKFDLAVCLEVVEHLAENASDNIVKNLTQLSDCILFSASIPGQMGQNHLNEQWPEYWQQKFAIYNYEMLDVLRPIFWNNKNLARWYKQNMFLVIKNGKSESLKALKHFSDNLILSFVHPEYYSLRVNEVIDQINYQNQLTSELATIKSGKASVGFYLKLMIKKLLRTFKI
jgi:SAM-dependent methyltransferase